MNKKTIQAVKEIKGNKPKEIEIQIKSDGN